jgi:hypothetical protein
MEMSLGDRLNSDTSNDGQRMTRMTFPTNLGFGNGTHMGNSSVSSVIRHLEAINGGEAFFLADPSEATVRHSCQFWRTIHPPSNSQSAFYACKINVLIPLGRYGAAPGKHAPLFEGLHCFRLIRTPITPRLPRRSRRIAAG